MDAPELARVTGLWKHARSWTYRQEMRSSGEPADKGFVLVRSKVQLGAAATQTLSRERAIEKGITGRRTYIMRLRSVSFVSLAVSRNI